MNVAEVVGRTLSRLGVAHVFGVVGSGNFHFTSAMVAQGTPYTPARHENGAATMADAYARISGEVTAVSLHQGCGFTNALTGITEASKSRSPVLVLTADTPPTDQGSNFWIEQKETCQALGIEVERIYSPQTAVADAIRAYSRARRDRRTVVLNIPVDVQRLEYDGPQLDIEPIALWDAPAPSPTVIDELVALIRNAQRPLLLAGRGATSAREPIASLADACGGLLATTAAARGLFKGHDWDLDVMGGFSTPLAVELISASDLIIAFGASLNNWTARSGSLTEGAVLVQVDLEPTAFAQHRPVRLGVLGDTGKVAAAVTDRLSSTADFQPARLRTAELADRIARERSWSGLPYEDMGTADRMDPRTVTIAFDQALPDQRIVVPDGGNFTGYPAMFFSVPDHKGYCFTQAFQSIGLGIASSIGASLADRTRTVICGVGDGGFMMSCNELDTAVRNHLPLIVVVYNDSAYGAEIHHFDPEGPARDMVTFPETDIAAVARGLGCDGVTVRNREELEQAVAVAASQPERTKPLVVDAKITSFPSWVLLAHAAGAMK